MLRKIGIAAAIVCSQFAVALVVREVPVFADGNPATNGIANRLAYSGRVELDGQPYNGALVMRFSLYDGAAGGEVFSEQQTLTVSNGSFAVQLGATGDIGSVINNADDLHLGIDILGTDTATFASPVMLQNRQRILPAAYSFHAQEAVDLTVNRDLFVARNSQLLGDLDVGGAVSAAGGIATSSLLANEGRFGAITAEDVFSNGDVIALGNVISSSDVVGRNLVLSPSGGEVTDFGILRGSTSGFEIFAGSRFVARVFSDGDVTFDRGVVASSGLQYLGATATSRNEANESFATIAADAAVAYDITEQTCPSGTLMVGVALFNDTESFTIPGVGAFNASVVALRPRCTAVP